MPTVKRKRGKLMVQSGSKLFGALKEIGVDVDKTISRFMDNSEIYIKFLKRFPDEDRITPIKTAAAEHDCAALAEKAHKLKGVAANLGMDELSQAAEVIVKKAKNDTSDGLDDDITLIERLNEEICRVIRDANNQ